MTTTDLSDIVIRPESVKARENARQRFQIKSNTIRENITGYLFVSPAILLIFIFGIFPIGYAIYMSVNQWIIRRGTSMCDVPIVRGAEPETGFIGVLRQCLRHYEISILGSWNGVLTATIGFTSLFIVYWMWVNVFTDKPRQPRSIINRLFMAGVLALALFIVIQNQTWDAITTTVLTLVIGVGMVWYTTSTLRAPLRSEEPPIVQQAAQFFRYFIGGGLAILAAVSAVVMLAGVVLLIQNFSIQAILAAYGGLLFLLAVYLLIAMDNDILKTAPVTLRIERLLMISLRVIGVALLANITVATGIGIGLNLMGADLTWPLAVAFIYATLAVIGLLGVPFGIYVLGDELEALRIRGFVFPLLAVFMVIAFLGVRIELADGTTVNYFAKQFFDVGFLVIGEVLNAIQWTSLVLFYFGLLLLIVAYRFWVDAFKPESRRALARWMVALALLAVSFAVISYGWNEMTGELSRRDRSFLRGLEITVYYAFASIPLQLLLGLLLAYVLFQNIAGKEWFRMIFFIPYVTPAVAAAVVFLRIFNGGSTSLMNSFMDSIGASTYRWVNEPRPFLNVVFDLELTGFIAGPSMALVSVVILGVWTYTGYNAIIFLAGLGGIPNDLYEAAKVDGASQWHLFRYITLPLLSPITFYLSLLGFIGTFQAFNTLFVMRTPSAGGTLDTAGLVIYDTFRDQTNYGLAAAQAIVLFIVILIMTQLQRNVFEKRVFYG